MSAGVVDEARTFFEDGWIEEVLFPVKSGKEATVYCCRACPGRGKAYFALKAYLLPHPRFHSLAAFERRPTSRRACRALSERAGVRNPSQRTKPLSR